MRKEQDIMDTRNRHHTYDTPGSVITPPDLEPPTYAPERSGFPRWARVTAALAAVAVPVAVWAGPKVLSKGGENIGGSATSTSAPVTAGETAPSTVEAVTADNVKLQIGNKTIIGVEEFFKEVAVTRNNNPNLPAPTQAEGLEQFEDYVEAVKKVANTTTTPEGEALREQAGRDALFTDGESGPLSEFVAEIQERGGTIVDANNVALTGPPEERYLVHGKAIFAVTYPDGTSEQWRMTADIHNQSGIIRNVPGVSTIAKLPN